MPAEQTVNRPPVRTWPRSVLLAGSILLASGIVWGCAGQAMAVALATSQATRAAGSTSDAVEAASAIDTFGLELLWPLLGHSGNGVFSPTSIALALSIAQAGARGETASQMDSALYGALGSGAGNGINSLDQSLAELSGTYAGPDGSLQKLTLHIANAPFAQAGMTWEQAYLDTLASRFGAGLRLVDYKQDAAGACRAINGWVSDQTEARIPHLLASLDASARLVLVNAIYLKAPWLKPFDEGGTADRPFTRLDRSQVNVPTMSVGLSEARYASGTGWQAVEIPYTNPALAMTIIVPDDLATFENGLDSIRFGEITAALAPASVDLSMPRFKVETKTDLSSALASMGMPLAFEGDKADFSGMTTQERLFIAQVVHQANISVDEKGTEASAATAVVMALASAPAREPVTLHVDKPFLFAVRDTRTGAILFLGRVVDPSV